MRRLLRVGLFGFLAFVVLVVLALAVVHTGPVQRWAWQEVVTRLEDASGWRIDAAEVSFRLWPARLQLAGVALASEAGELATAEQLEASWGWLALTGSPPRLDTARIAGAAVDLRRIPSGGADAEEDGVGLEAMLEAAEIGELVVERGRLGAGAEVADVSLEGLRLEAGLQQGRLDLTAVATDVVAIRDGRELRAGPLQLRASGTGEGLTIDQLRLRGVPVQAELEGRVGPGPDLVLSLHGWVEADAETVARWWDPEVQRQMSPGGRLRLEGRASLDPGGVSVYLVHQGAEVEVAGYRLDHLVLDLRPDVVEVDASGMGWGQANVRVTEGRRAEIRAALRRAPVGPVLAWVELPSGLRVPRETTLSGTVSGTVGLPLEAADLQGDFDLEASWHGGSLALRGRAGQGRAEVRRFQVAFPGARLGGHLSLEPDHRLAGRLDATVSDVGKAVAGARRWLPQLPVIPDVSGSVTAEVRFAGPPASPRLEVEAVWRDPLPEMPALQSVQLTAAGGLDEADWSLVVQGRDDLRVEARGTARPATAEVEGRWILGETEFAALEPFLPAAPTGEIAGRLGGEGGFRWTEQERKATATVVAHELELRGWKLDRVLLDVEADGEQIRVDRLDVAGMGATLEGSGALGWPFGQGEVAAQVELRGLRPSRLPGHPERTPEGSIDAELAVSGTVDRPVAVLEGRWKPAGDDSLMREVEVVAALEDGIVSLVTRQLRTTVGSAVVQARLPLGDVPRPPWLWPEAEGGALRASAHVDRLESEPVLALLGVGPVPARLVTAVEADVHWSLVDPSDRRAEIALPGLEIRTTGELLEPRTVPALRVQGRRVVLEPLRLEGRTSEVRASGTLDLADPMSVDASVSLVLAPSLVRSLPLALDSTGPVHVEASVSGPVASPEAHVVLSLPEGSLVMRDPPVEAADVHIELAWHDGYLAVEDGSASVNRGEVLLGGEWNPETGQGLIFELENVNFLLEGILTRWSGAVVFEPASGRLGRLVGELILERGLWDEPVDFTAMVLGEDPTAEVVDEALYDVVVDLEVRGRGGVHVDNNLGQFDLSWNTLLVGGTLAEPTLEGEMQIASGGVLSLSGRPIEIRQGTVVFSGVPGAEPAIEIVPQNTLTGVDAGGGGSFDAEALARRGIASGLGQSLGLRNTTLTPADIAVETGSSTRSGYLVARQIGRYIALFFTSDLSEVQDQTALLQLYNWSKLPGLALQVFDATERGQGYAVFERYRWGGTADDERLRIRGVSLEGEWPLSKRRLKKAARLRRGQPWDPFLLFVGRARLERELASAGYYRPRVTGRTSEDETLVKVEYTVEPGPHQAVEFRGGDLPKEARREIVSRYQPPPMEEISFGSMRAIAIQQLAARQHPRAEVEVWRDGEVVIVDVAAGPELELQGPRLDDAPVEVEQALQRVLGSPVELARLLRQPQLGLRRVERILAGEGFRQARASSVHLEESEDEQEQATVVVEASLGARATIAEVQVVGSDPLGLASKGELGVRAGDPLRQALVDAAVRRLRRGYREKGYLEVDVGSEILPLDDGRWRVVLTLETEAQKRIAEINITGRRHVSLSVLRDGLEVAEGDVATPSAIDESVLQVAGFGPIERVDLETRNVSSDRVALDLAVTERDRWTAGVGVRWSSDFGRQLLLDLRDDSLFGRGVSVNLRASRGDDLEIYRLISAIPRGPGGRISTSLILEYLEEPTPDNPDEFYNTERSATLEASYLLSEQATVRGYYQFGETRTRELEPGPFFPIDFTTRVSTLGGQAILDRLNDPLNPTEGFYLAADASWTSSKLGGQLDTLRGLLTASLALEPRTRWTWHQSARLGLARGLRGTDVDPAIRFYAGGQSSIRGFERNLVGPLTVDDEGNPDPSGGNALFLLNEELRVPVWGPLKVAVFTDLGQVWPDWSDADLDLAIGAGIGLRWDTPIGPLWGDVAWPVANRQVSEGPKYYIGIGRPF